jgi:hypothetical protein
LKNWDNVYLRGSIRPVECYYIIILARLTVRDELLPCSAGEFLFYLNFWSRYIAGGRTFNVNFEERLSHSLRACEISPMRRADCDMMNMWFGDYAGMLDARNDVADILLTL